MVPRGPVTPKGKDMLDRLLAVCGALLIFTACSRSGGETTPISSSASAGATSPPASSTGPSAYSIDGDVFGGDDNPSFTVQAPLGWSTDGHFVTNMGSGVLGLSVWDVGRVPRDPCHWQGNLRDPGPTVDDLVAALTAQEERNATKPTDVTLGGYDGQYLEWSVPDDWKVTGDAEFHGCDVEPSSGLRDFVSWLGDGEGERYQQEASQVDRLWVLNVDGHRLVLDATFVPDTAEADRAELANIAESIRFNEPAA